MMNEIHKSMLPSITDIARAMYENERKQRGFVTPSWSKIPKYEKEPFLRMGELASNLLLGEVDSHILLSARYYHLLLLATFRYSLGRSTYMTSVCVDALTSAWKKLPTGYKKQIHEDIARAIANNVAGDECDISVWKKLLELPEQDHA